MAYIAVTNIKHGNEDGSTVEFAAGDEVTGLSGDVIDNLLEAGAIVDDSDEEALEEAGLSDDELDDEAPDDDE